jgi:hypothetical protein
MTDKTSLGDERIAEIRADIDCGSYFERYRVPEQIEQDIRNLIAALTTLQAEVEAREADLINHGSSMMAAQIRKAIEGGGRFSDDNANWILDKVAEVEAREQARRSNNVLG